MLLNNGEYSEAVLRFEELAAYKDSCKLRMKCWKIMIVIMCLLNAQKFLYGINYTKIYT